MFHSIGGAKHWFGIFNFLTPKHWKLPAVLANCLPSRVSHHIQKKGSKIRFNVFEDLQVRNSPKGHLDVSTLVELGGILILSIGYHRR